MNPKIPKLQQQQRPQKQEQEQETTEQNASGVAREFASAEEMLRHDAEGTGPPKALAHRVAESIAREPRPARSWWQRWFSRRPPGS